MSAGRIELILIATTSGNVIYERFYERVGEHEKAELRENLAEAAEKCRSRLDHSEFASRYRQVEGFKIVLILIQHSSKAASSGLSR